jgi:fatty-acyl-CoA synthase
MQGGWFHSGDVGVLDDDRYIKVVDRMKDMIKSGGENISTREVEEVIYQDTRVQEVAVIGLNHPKWVEAVVAVVVPKRGETIREEEIVSLCRSEPAPFKIPKAVLFREELPKPPAARSSKETCARSTGNFSMSEHCVEVIKPAYKKTFDRIYRIDRNTTGQRQNRI